MMKALVASTVFFGLLSIGISTAAAKTAQEESPPRSDGCVFNVDFEGYMDGGVGFLNAGVRQLGDGDPSIWQTEAAVVNDSNLAFSGNRCARIVAKQPGPRAQIGLQRRFDVPDVSDAVIEFVFRPTSDKPVDLDEFVVWLGDGNGGIVLVANGSTSSGTYSLSAQSGSNAASRVKDVVAGLKQTEWIRVILARNQADKNVSLWVGPPEKERYVGQYPDADPDRCVGRAELGNPWATDVHGSGYWDDIRVGKALSPGGKVAPAEVVRDVGRELPVIKYPIVVGSEKQLFVDDAVIESITGLKRTLHPLDKHPRNPILTPEKPWELDCRWFWPFVVTREAPGKQLRVWYGCYVREPENQPKKKLTYLCLAESTDGLQWTRPSVNRYTVNGVKENSAVWEGRAFKPIVDPRDPDPGRRYKGMTRVAGFSPIFSPDGIRWTMMPDGVVSQAYDATSFSWDPVGNKWIASCKVFRDKKRIRGYAESPDFLHWSDTYPMLAADAKDGPKDQTYSMRIFRYESVYVGLLKIYHLDTDRCELQLAFSRNAKHWERPDRSFFLPNSTQKGSCDYGNIDDAGDPIRMDDQLWFYYSGLSTLHNEKSDKVDGSLCLGTLRLDGFISMDAGDAEGTLTTRPVKFQGKHLFVNAAAQGGELWVEILDQQGKVIEPFTKANCVPMGADKTLAEVRWKGAKDLSALSNKPVKFRFTLHNGSLYSFWVNSDASGASHGYVAAGGPGFTGPTDTVGQASRFIRDIATSFFVTVPSQVLPNAKDRTIPCR